MKNSMPRLIYDTRVKWVRCIAAGLAVATVSATVGYNSWMKPYRQRRADIGAVIREGTSFATSMRDDAGIDTERRLETALNNLRELDRKRCQPAEDDTLEIDPSIYIPEDRNRAENLNAEFKSASTLRNLAANEVAAAVQDATALATNIRGLMGGKNRYAVMNAYSDMSQCLRELTALQKQPRPKAGLVVEATKRYNAVYVKALLVRDNYMEWTANANNAVGNSQKTVAAFAAAMENLQQEQQRIETIRKETESLRIDRNGGRLEMLRREIANAAAELEKCEKELSDAEKTAERMRSELKEKARKHCTEVAERVAVLSDAHGALLPRDAVAAAQKVPETFAALEKEDDSIWNSRKTTVAKLFDRAKDLRDECARSIKTIGDIVDTGTGFSYSNQISGLPDRARTFEKELSAAASLLSLDELNARLDAIVSQSKKDLASVEAGKPDVPALVKTIREAAKDIRNSLDSAKSRLIKLGSTVERGCGEDRENLRKSVADCSKTLASTQFDLQVIEMSDAANGKEVLELEKRLGTVRGGANNLFAAIDGLDARIKQAIESGRFALISWEPGALGWIPDTSSTRKTVVVEDVLVAPEGTLYPEYKWEFDLDIVNPGTHTIEVRVSPSARNGIYNLNTDMPNRTYSVETKRNRAKGGWIRAECSLSSGNRKWSDSKPLANRTRMESTETVILSANETLAKGRTSFQLDIGLSIDTSLMDEKQRAGLPDVSKGWRPEGLAVRIYLDGEQVRQFWHRR